MLGTFAPHLTCSDHSPRRSCTCSFHPRWQSQCFHISGHRSPTLHIHCGLKVGNIEKPEVLVKFFVVTLSSLVEPLEKVTGQYLQQTRRLDINEKNQQKKTVTHRYTICCHWPPSSPGGRRRCRPPESSCSRGHSRDSRTDCSLKHHQGSMIGKSAKLLEILNTTKILFQSNKELLQWVNEPKFPLSVMNLVLNFSSGH